MSRNDPVRLLALSKAALAQYDRNPFLRGAPNADFAEAITHVGDNATGSTNPDDYDENGAMLKGLKSARGN